MRLLTSAGSLSHSATALNCPEHLAHLDSEQVQCQEHGIYQPVRQIAGCTFLPAPQQGFLKQPSLRESADLPETSKGLPHSAESVYIPD